MSRTLDFRLPLRGAWLAAAPQDQSDCPTTNEVSTAEVEAQLRLETAVKQAREEERRQVEAELANEREALNALREGLLARLSEVEADLAGQVEAVLPELIIEGVGRVLKAWQPDADTVRKLVVEILAEHAESHQAARLWISVRDLDLLEAADASLRKSYPNLTLLADAELRSGEFVLESRFGQTDGRFETKVENLRKVLV
ncbi:hypothetical protein H5P28_12140 [Ruficoccus amylovorans]|uniref:Flagellar assembly protein FliH/Type III secretion system HrpE domain-containing protein n=1 Tax=Ruficoccus amylovorans TaxID=1804625 RepID=A0A842HG49_9BACT|nr:FliH/SctL family protein [Ruficoccus amylovorans]MBC2595008.1 hypothetical protein [Ruficoccus amylovorans]